MAFIEDGNGTAGIANVNGNFQLEVNLPTTASQSGFSRNTYVPAIGVSKDAQITEDGAFINGAIVPIWEISFNGASATWGTKLGTNATTMTKAVGNGYMLLNSGSSVTATQGISIYSTNVFSLFMQNELRIKVNVKHNNYAGTNKQMEWGMGYYNFASGQANDMNEFIGFRITAGGVLQGVLAYSTGGAPTETTILINSGVPFTNLENKEYELRISNKKIEYWVAGVYQGKINLANDVYAIVKAISYPFIARVFNSGTASVAPLLYIGTVQVSRIGDDGLADLPTAKARMDKGTHYFQPDLLTGNGVNPFNFPASGSTPTAATGSTSASVLNNAAQLGGFYAMNAASFLTTNNSNILVVSYLNPAIPPANGAGSNGRNLIITGVTVSAQIITTVVAGQTGGMGGQWFIAVGQTAVTMATTDADGTTAVAQKAPRLINHPRTFTFPVNAPAGTIETGSGDFTLYFNTPLVVHPAEYVAVGIRETLNPSVAATSGVIQGGIYINGYWE